MLLVFAQLRPLVARGGEGDGVCAWAGRAGGGGLTANDGPDDELGFTRGHIGERREVCWYHTVLLHTRTKEHSKIT